MITYTHDLDIVPGGNKVQIYLNQGDNDFRLEFNLFARNGTFSIESGTTARIRGSKPDGTAYNASAAISGEKITVTGATGLTDTPGKGVYEISLTHSGKELNSANFNIFVEKAPGTIT